MKKKLLTTVAVTTIVCAAAFTLFGCGGNEKPVTYTVTYEKGASDATGTAPAAVSYAEGAEITVAANTFTRTGYTFKTWSDGTATYAAGAKYTMPAKNVTFTAQWELATVQFSVVFKDGETTVATRTVTEGSEVELPDPPDAPAGKVFGGWFIKDTDTEVTEGYQPTQDLEVVARWDDAYTLTFKNGEEVYRTVVVVAGDKVRLPLAPEAKEGETFGGWFIKDTDTEVTADFVPEADAEIVAKWNKKQQVTVTFKNGETVVKTQTVFAGDTVTLPTENPTKPAFTFKGWQTPEGAVFDATKPVNASVELNPIWEIAFAGAWTRENNPEGGVDIVAKNGENGIVGYALDMDAQGLLFELKETELGFVARPIGLPASMVQGMRVLFEYSEEEDPELTISAIDEHDEVVPQSVRTYANVAAIQAHTLLNGTYTELAPQNPEKIGSLKIANGALTFTNIKEFDTANVLGFRYATAYFGDLEEEGDFFALLVNANDPNPSPEYADALMVMYSDSTMTNGGTQLILRKDLAVWGVDQVAFYELKKGQTISYAATIDSDPTQLYHGMITYIMTDAVGEMNGFFIRPDTFSEIVNGAWWQAATNMEAKFTPAFDEAKYKANAKGATVTTEVVLATDGKLTVTVVFTGAKTGDDKYDFKATFTATEVDFARVGFAHEGVTVKENGYTALPFGQYRIDIQDYNGSSINNDTVTVDYSDTGVTKFKLPAAPTYDDESLEFKGWLVGESTTPVAAGTEITLGTEPYVEIRAEVKKQVTVSFKVQDGKTATGEMADVTIEVDPNGGTYTLPACTFSVEGETFSGWLVNGSNESKNVGDIVVDVQNDIELTAIFASSESVYTVEFFANVEDEQPVASQTYDKEAGATLTLPSEPEKEGWNFLGWFVFTDDEQNPYGEELDSENLPTVTANAKYVAKWEQIKYTVTFKNGEETVKSAEVVYGNTLESFMTDIEAPTKQYYRFDGWFVDDKQITETTVPEGDIVATAKFTQVEALPKGEQNPTTESPIEYGTADNVLAWTALNPPWVGKIQKGEVVTLKGTMTSKGANHESVIAYIFSGMNPTSYIRSDNFFDGDTIKNGDTATDSFENWTITKRCYLNFEGELFAATIADADVTVTFDWSVDNSILITIEYQGKNDVTMHQCYFITPSAGHEFKNEYSIGLGGENCHVVINEKTSESIAPIYSSEQESITVGAENCVFGYTWLNPAWVGNPVSQGETVVIEGTVKSAGEFGWQVPIAYLFSGKISGSAFRLDGFNNSETYFGLDVAVQEGIAGASSNYQTGGANNGDTEFLTAIQEGVKLTLTYDYTASDKVIVTAVFAWGEGADAKSRTSTFTVTSESGELPESFNIGLGGENMYFVANVTRS